MSSNLLTGILLLLVFILIGLIVYWMKINDFSVANITNYDPIDRAAYNAAIKAEADSTPENCEAAKMALQKALDARPGVPSDMIHGVRARLKASKCNSIVAKYSPDIVPYLIERPV